MTQALKTENHFLHTGNLEFCLDQEKSELISGGSDCTIKIFNYDTKTDTIIDVSEEIQAIAFGCAKLAYGQKNNVQMIDNFNSSNFDIKSSVLMTNFNSTVRKILFNESLKLLVAFSEDDDIHIINLSTFDVNKYKSHHEGSLKNMKITTKGDLLISTGTDGFLCIYEFLKEDVGKIQNKKKLKISSKLSLENPQMLDIDMNEMNVCAIGGNILLKTMFVDTSSYEHLSVLSENSISHKADINFVKWVNNQILCTVDTSGNAKIWNYTTKTCIYEIDETSKDPVVGLNFVLLKQNLLTLFFIDNNGYLILTDKINLDTFSSNEKKKVNQFDSKYKMHAGNDNPERKNALDAIKEDFNSNTNSNHMNDIKSSTELNELNDDSNILKDVNLSDIEDEDGEVRPMQEIEKIREEKKQAMIEESMADKIIISLPQQALISSCTKPSDAKESRYLCWNLIGQIVARKESNFNSIDITFADISNKKKISFIDTNDMCLAVMNNCGAFLANKTEEENDDEYEKEDKPKQAVIEFKSIHTGTYSLLKDWSITLPQEENPLCLAIGVDWCAVYTTSFYLRTFSLFGTQKIILSLPHVIAMAGYENHLAYVYHSATPLLGVQTLRFKILDSNNLFNEIYDGMLPLSPLNDNNNDSILSWFGYSEEGVLITYDSEKVLRGFFFNISNNWIPLHEFKDTLNTNFWLVGIQDEEIYGLELKSHLVEPLVGVKLPMKVLKIKMPFLSTNTDDTKEEAIEKSSEEKILHDILFIKNDNKRFDNFSQIKTLRNVKSPDYYYTDNLKDEKEIANRKKDNDKFVLSCMRDYIVSGHPEKAVDLFDSLLLSKNRDNAIILSAHLEEKGLEHLLKNKREIIRQREERFANLNNTDIHRYISKAETEEAIENKNSSVLKQKVDVVGPKQNILFNFAINVDNMKSLEEEVRNEMNNKDNNNEEWNNEDVNAIVQGNMNKLEKKIQTLFLKVKPPSKI